MKPHKGTHTMERLAHVMAARMEKGDVEGAMNQFNLFTAKMSDADVSKAMEALSGLLY